MEALMLEANILAEARTTIKKILSMPRGDMPFDTMIECPFCHYSDERGRLSAKIYSNTGLFKCFACNERRKII